MSEAGGVEAAAVEAPPSEVGSSGSLSRKGSTAAPAGTQRRLSANPDGENAAGEQGRRISASSVKAPSSGGNDSMGSLHEDGAAEEAGPTAGDIRNLSVVSTTEGGEESYREVAGWVKEHLVLPEFVPEKHWREEHDEVSCPGSVSYHNQG